MNRRALLKLAPAAIVATPATALCVADSETPVMRLFRQWVVASEQCDRVGLSLPETREGDAIYEAFLEKVGDIECAMLKAPCQSAQDFIAKVIAWTDHGMHTLPDMQGDPAFWAEARALVQAQPMGEA